MCDGPRLLCGWQLIGSQQFSRVVIIGRERPHGTQSCDRKHLRLVMQGNEDVMSNNVKPLKAFTCSITNRIYRKKLYIHLNHGSYNTCRNVTVHFDRR